MTPKNVVILGSAYGGGAVARVLAQRLPKTHRAVVVDKHSHFNHVYLFPRYGVLGPGHAHKAFIPEPLYSTSPNVPLVLRAKAVSLGDGYLELDRSVDDADVSRAYSEGDVASASPWVENGHSHAHDNGLDRRVSWDYLVYALGCDLPPVLATDARTKTDGIAYLDAQAKTIARAKSILVAGGGALGIQYATDIADLYNNEAHAKLRPEGVHPKNITIVHSRSRFLPLYSQALHDAIMGRMDALGINVILEDRVELPSTEERLQMEDNAEKRTSVTVRTKKGKSIECDLLLQCTGQRPNSSLLREYIPEIVDSAGFVCVAPTMQAAPKIFAIGDIADAGVVKAGHSAWDMGTIAGENVVSLINGTDVRQLSRFEKTPPQIKLTLGLKHMATEMLPTPEHKETVVSEHTEGHIDGYWEFMWKSWGADPSDPTR